MCVYIVMASKRAAAARVRRPFFTSLRQGCGEEAFEVRFYFGIVEAGYTYGDFFKSDEFSIVMGFERGFNDIKKNI